MKRVQILFEDVSVTCFPQLQLIFKELFGCNYLNGTTNSASIIILKITVPTYAFEED